MIVLHYHLFKNAGTSVDAMLAANFGKRWVEHEFAVKPRRSNVEAVREFLTASPDLAALSSHTALLPVPVIDEVEVFPILFVRHPLLRIASAYAFERKQQADSGGARLARATDFAGYLRTLLDQRGPNQVQNFQTARLAFFEPDESLPLLDRARAACAGLPFIGLVERYDRSITKLVRLLRPRLPSFEPLIVRRNANTDREGRIEARLTAVRDEIGEDLYRELIAANSDDLAIHRLVQEQYARRKHKEGRAGC